MVKKILLGVAAVVAVLVLGFVTLAALQPNDYRITRSATMAAPASRVFPQVNNFQHWNDWSPWAKLDPNAKYAFEGPEAGEGATFRWDGNEQVGAGSMTILESRPDERVRMKLEFVRPFPDQCTTEFELQPQGGQTLVTWTMVGKHQNFMSKAMCLVMNMDKMVGSDFEKGLANMKAVVEAPEAKAGEAKATPAAADAPAPPSAAEKAADGTASPAAVDKAGADTLAAPAEKSATSPTAETPKQDR